MSRLEEISTGFRENLLVKNDHKQDNQYSSEHPDALSNGDDYGKGEFNNQIGGITDIKMRETLLVKNKYKKNNEYNASNA